MQKKLKYIVFALMIFLLSTNNVFALSNSSGSWIDAPVFNALAYFTSLYTSFYQIALQLGRIICIIAVVWDFVQMAFGTMEQRKFIVSWISKWFIFWTVMNFYPAVTSYIQKLSIRVGVEVSAQQLNAAAEKIGGMKDALMEVMTKKEAELSAKVEQLNKIKQRVDGVANGAMVVGTSAIALGSHTAQPIVVTGGAVSFVAGSALKIVNDLSYKYQEKKLDKSRAKISGWAKKTDALKSILGQIDEKGNVSGNKVDKYFLNIWHVNSNGNQTDFLSPSAVYKIILFTCQLIWEGEFAEGFEETTIANDPLNNVEKENNEVQNNVEKPKKKIPLTETTINTLGMFLIKIVIIFFAAITTGACLVQYIMGIVEFTIINTMGILLIPFMIWDGTKDIAQKMINTILQQSIKMVAITMMIAYTINQVANLAFNTFGNSANFTIATALFIVFNCLLCFALCSNAPKIASALMTGSPQMSMGEFMQAVAAGGVGAKMASSGVRAGVNAAKFATNAAGKVAGAGINVAGSLAAAGGAFSASKNAGGDFRTNAKAFAGSVGKDITGGLGTTFNNWAKGSGKGGGGSGAGGGGGMYNNSYAGDSANENQLSKTGVGAKNFKNAQNANGTSQGMSEFWKARFEQGKNNYKPRTRYTGDDFGINER